MIIVRLQGGLGNQMFQYAAAAGLAAKHDASVALDVSWYDTADQSDGVGRRFYELDGFALPQNFYRHNLYRRLARKLHGGGYYAEGERNPYQFHPGVLELPDYSVLVGYFQNEKYFSAIRPQILKAFSWRRAPEGKNRELLDRIQADDGAVSVHVRRGDYATSKAHSAFHGLVGLEYYRQAIKRMRQTLAQPTLYVFSDEPAWCKQHLQLGTETVYVDHNNGVGQGTQDLRLMQACRHNIIANSSFSWWGAWLNQNPDKTVIAPKIWLASGAFDTSDATPGEWIRL